MPVLSWSFDAGREGDAAGREARRARPDAEQVRRHRSGRGPGEARSLTQARHVRRRLPGRSARPARPSEPILIPKLRIQFAEFPYHTFFYQLEALHLGDLMRFTVRPGLLPRSTASTGFSRDLT